MEQLKEYYREVDPTPSGGKGGEPWGLPGGPGSVGVQEQGKCLYCIVLYCIVYVDVRVCVSLCSRTFLFCIEA